MSALFVAAHAHGMAPIKPEKLKNRPQDFLHHMTDTKKQLDNDFMNYLRWRMLRPEKTHKQAKLPKKNPPVTLQAKELKVGRKRPRYCELHEALYLDPRTDKPPHADHNHSNGKYRGWICMTCNIQLLPEIDRLRQAGVDAEYIKTFLTLIVDYVFTDGAVLFKRGLVSKRPWEDEFEK